MSKDLGTPESFTLDMVKKMGHNPIKITEFEGDEVFVFETDEEASEAEYDFAPEGIWVSEAGLASYKIKSKVHLLIEPEVAAEEDVKTIDFNGKKIQFRGSLKDEPAIKKVAEKLGELGAKTVSRLTKTVDYVVYLDEKELETSESADVKSSIVEYGVTPITFGQLTNAWLYTVKQNSKDNPFKDKTFVFSGFRSEAYESFITQWDGTVGANVTKKTDVLIVKSHSTETDKVKKAKSYGIKIVDEAEFVLLSKKAIHQKPVVKSKVKI